MPSKVKRNKWKTAIALTIGTLTIFLFLIISLMQALAATISDSNAAITSVDKDLIERDSFDCFTSQCYLYEKIYPYKSDDFYGALVLPKKAGSVIKTEVWKSYLEPVYGQSCSNITDINGTKKSVCSTIISKYNTKWHWEDISKSTIGDETKTSKYSVEKDNPIYLRYLYKPIFGTYIKYSLLSYDSLFSKTDLDPFANSTTYLADFSIDINTTLSYNYSRTGQNVTILKAGTEDYWYKFDGNLNDSADNNGLAAQGTLNYNTTTYKLGNSSIDFLDSAIYLNTTWSNASSLSVSYWIYFSTVGAPYMIYVPSVGGINKIENYVSVGKIRLVVGDSVGLKILDTTTTVAVNTWYHVAFVITNNTNMVIYLNGSATVDDEVFNIFVSGINPDVRIGDIGSTQTYKIDDLRFYLNKTLTQDDINTLYNSGSGTTNGVGGGSTFKTYKAVITSQIFNMSNNKTNFIVNTTTSTLNSSVGIWYDISCDNGATWRRNITLNTQYSCLGSGTQNFIYNVTLVTSDLNVSPTLMGLQVDFLEANVLGVNNITLARVNTTNSTYDIDIPKFNQIIGFNASVNSTSGNATLWVNLTVQMPNGTLIINNQNMTRRGGNDSDSDWLSRTNITINQWGTWRYSINAYDGISFVQSITYNFTITETTPPNITLNFPINLSTMQNNSVINFTANVSDNGGFGNCSLFVNYSTGNVFTAILNSTAITNNTEINFSYRINRADNYIWNIRCYDTSGNIAWGNSNLTLQVRANNATLNISAVNNLTLNAIINFSVLNFSYINIYKNYNTTNGSIEIFYLNNYTFNFTIRADNYISRFEIGSSTDTHVNYKVTMQPIYIDNCTNTTASTLTLLLYDEDNSTKIYGNIDVGFDLIYVSNLTVNDTASFNFTMRGQNNLTICISPNNATFVANAILSYWADWYVKRNYFLYQYLLTNVSRNLPLYLLNSTESSNILLTVTDQDGYGLEGYYIKVLRYYPGEAAFKVVESLKTDNNGNSLAHMIAYTTLYKFIIQRSNETMRQTGQTPILQSTMKFIINLIQNNFVTEQLEIGQAQSILTFDNNTNMYDFTFSDLTGSVVQGCLRVWYMRPTGRTTICDSCLTASAGSVLCNVTGYNYTTYAQGGFQTDNPFTFFPVKFLENNIELSFFGAMGIFAAMLMVAVIGLLASFNPAVAIIFTVGAMIITYISGFMLLSYTSILILVVLGGWMVFKMYNT